MNRLSRGVIAFVNEIKGVEKKSGKPEFNSDEFFNAVGYDKEGVEEDVSKLNEVFKEIELSKIKQREADRRNGITGKRNRENAK